VKWFTTFKWSICTSKRNCEKFFWSWIKKKGFSLVDLAMVNWNSLLRLEIMHSNFASQNFLFIKCVKIFHQIGKLGWWHFLHANDIMKWTHECEHEPMNMSLWTRTNLFGIQNIFSISPCHVRMKNVKVMTDGNYSTCTIFTSKFIYEKRCQRWNSKKIITM
jgi:hypothetical protein